MDILSSGTYTPPSILFLRGVFLDDCSSYKKIFDTKLVSNTVQDVSLR